VIVRLVGVLSHFIYIEIGVLVQQQLAVLVLTVQLLPPHTESYDKLDMGNVQNTEGKVW
jgi:hypothetical protein